SKSWIDTNSQAQEIWARKYLIKKKAELTSSGDGLVASNRWRGQMPALVFLTSLEQNTKCEHSSLLLKKMKAAWDQQVRKSKAKKTRPVYISIKSSNQLQQLAKANKQTQVMAMEALIASHYATHKNEVIQRKHHKILQRKEINNLEMHLVSLTDENKKLTCEVEAQSINIERLESELSLKKAKVRQLNIELTKKEKELKDLYAKNTINKLEKY
ncbi:hypothetical protein ACQKPX_24700, partial [Photobacterium sp. DNB23_23_1]